MYVKSPGHDHFHEKYFTSLKYAQMFIGTYGSYYTSWNLNRISGYYVEVGELMLDRISSGGSS